MFIHLYLLLINTTYILLINIVKLYNFKMYIILRIVALLLFFFFFFNSYGYSIRLDSSYLLHKSSKCLYSTTQCGHVNSWPPIYVLFPYSNRFPQLVMFALMYWGSDWLNIIFVHWLVLHSVFTIIVFFF